MVNSTLSIQVLTDTHPKVQSAGQTALQQVNLSSLKSYVRYVVSIASRNACCIHQVGSVIKNPEISSLVPTLLMGLTDPNEYTKHSLDILLQVSFQNIFLKTIHNFLLLLILLL